MVDRHHGESQWPAVERGGAEVESDSAFSLDKAPLVGAVVGAT